MYVSVKQTLIPGKWGLYVGVKQTMLKTKHAHLGHILLQAKNLFHKRQKTVLMISKRGPHSISADIFLLSGKEQSQ